jgi:hypothetical protein
MNGRSTWAVQDTSPRSHVFPNPANHDRSHAAESGAVFVRPLRSREGRPRDWLSAPNRVVSRPRDAPRRLQSPNVRSRDDELHRSPVPEPGGTPLGGFSRRFRVLQGRPGKPEAAFVVFGVESGIREVSRRGRSRSRMVPAARPLERGAKCASSVTTVRRRNAEPKVRFERTLYPGPTPGERDVNRGARCRSDDGLPTSFFPFTQTTFIRHDGHDLTG